jgi:O-antigen ligase
VQLVAGLILAATVMTLSRMGFFAALCGLYFVGALTLGAKISGRTRWIATGVLGGLLLLALIYLPTDALMSRMVNVAQGQEITGEGRVRIWNETLPLVPSYPFFGSGLGSFEFAFYRVKDTFPHAKVDFAHNDYLQILVELGVIGFAIVATLVIAVLAHAIRALRRAANYDAHALAIACSGALVAILVHSTADFNLYIPANAMLVAWIAGISLGLPLASGRGRAPANADQPDP